MVLGRRRLEELIEENTEQLGALVATVEEVQAQLTTLTTDLDALATTAKAEFEKLEKELKEAGITPASLDPLKTQIEALDAKVKAAQTEVPTN